MSIIFSPDSLRQQVEGCPLAATSPFFTMTKVTPRTCALSPSFAMKIWHGFRSGHRRSNSFSRQRARRDQKSLSVNIRHRFMRAAPLDCLARIRKPPLTTTPQRQRAKTRARVGT